MGSLSRNTARATLTHSPSLKPWNILLSPKF
jgi:hypothetical protein